jgi:hypothetical protein
VLPNDGLRIPILSTVSPQAFIGTCIGTCTTLPDRVPGDPPKAFDECRGICDRCIYSFTISLGTCIKL